MPGGAQRPDQTRMGVEPIHPLSVLQPFEWPCTRDCEQPSTAQGDQVDDPETSIGQGEQPDTFPHQSVTIMLRLSAMCTLLTPSTYHTEFVLAKVLQLHCFALAQRP